MKNRIFDFEGLAYGSLLYVSVCFNVFVVGASSFKLLTTRQEWKPNTSSVKTTLTIMGLWWHERNRICQFPQALPLIHIHVHQPKNRCCILLCTKLELPEVRKPTFTLSKMLFFKRTREVVIKDGYTDRPVSDTRTFSCNQKFSGLPVNQFFGTRNYSTENIIGRYKHTKSNNNTGSSKQTSILVS